VQERSPLRGYPGHDALLSFSHFLKKNLDKYVVTDRTRERIFGGMLLLAKGKDGDLCVTR
jgi:hypothetical protein